MTAEKAMTEMEGYISNFPANLSRALEIGEAAISTFRTRSVSNVLIAGLGGSGIGGKIVGNLVSEHCSVPIVVQHDYRIPNWVGPQTLFVAVSYSGNTEETLAALGEAISAGAEICAVTSGGKLLEICIDQDFNYIKIPDGQPPRTSFGYNATQQFFVLRAYGLIDSSFFNDLKESAELLLKHNGLIRAEAAAIAHKIVGTIPVIYSESLLEGVAIRFRQQINENAKMLCWHHSLPEMNHNELVGWAGAQEGLSAIFITTPDDFPATKRRMALSRGIVEKHTDKVVTLEPKGKNRIQRAYYLINLVDWISYYLAVERKTDPIEIDVIDYFKSELAKK